ncbi:MAG: PLDc N-terminal domain-containing protein [Actinomycetota bacterium]|nr:PLDc N-terminal domain-containing protein [Actinomycetota bacterium]
MLYGGGLLAIVVFALWVYCILDVIATDEAAMRNMPKLLWLIVVILLPTVGSVAWLVLGRPRNAGYVPGDTTRRRLPRPERARPLGPEDSPEFISELDDRAARLRKWEEDLNRREEEIRRDEDGDSPSGEAPGPS